MTMATEASLGPMHLCDVFRSHGRSWLCWLDLIALFGHPQSDWITARDFASSIDLCRRRIAPSPSDRALGSSREFASRGGEALLLAQEKINLSSVNIRFPTRPGTGDSWPVFGRAWSRPVVAGVFGPWQETRAFLRGAEVPQRKAFRRDVGQ